MVDTDLNTAATGGTDLITAATGDTDRNKGMVTEEAMEDTEEAMEDTEALLTEVPMEITFLPDTETKARTKPTKIPKATKFPSLITPTLTIISTKFTTTQTLRTITKRTPLTSKSNGICKTANMNTSNRRGNLRDHNDHGDGLVGRFH